MTQVYTISEAAQLLKQSRTSIYRLCRTGGLPGAYKTGQQGVTSHWRIPATSIDKYQASSA